MLLNLPPASKEDINKIIQSLKATGPVGVPLELFKLSANFADKYLTGIINHISRSYFSDRAKNALVRPICEKPGKIRKINV